MAKFMHQKGGALTRGVKSMLESLIEIDDENELVCELGKSKYGINEITTDLLFNTINKYVTMYKNDPFNYSDEKIRSIMIQELKEKTKTVKINEQNEIQGREVELLLQIGFTEEELNKMFAIVFSERDGITKFRQLPFISLKKHAVTTSIYILAQANMIADIILYGKFNTSNKGSVNLLRDEFLEELRKLYNLPSSFNIYDFLSILEKAKLRGTTAEEKARIEFTYKRFVTKIIHLRHCISALYQRNYSYEYFSKNRIERDLNGNRKDGKLDKIVSVSELKCFQDLNIVDTKGNTRDIYIEDATNIYDLSGTFTSYIFEKYGIPQKGGVSGSVYETYFLIFEVMQYKKTPINILKVILIAIFDYIPIWHSLSEILMTITGELREYHEEYNFPIYTLDENPLDYFKTLVRHVIELEEKGKLPQQETKGGNKHRTHKRKMGKRRMGKTKKRTAK
jgi:hypothetical protein